MEENVALDSKKQKNFVKSLKGIKKLMKKTGAIPEKPKREKKVTKHGKITKKKRKARGLVYLSHIPHGFYEHQMTEYFKQFGVVTNARVIRSKHTGQSKGYAFVEFKDISVAQVVAETMNNYLMGKRLIKAVYIPPKDQRENAMRKNWNAQCNPGSKLRLAIKKSYNAEKNDKEDLKIGRKLLSNLATTKKKLKEINIDYDFFTPVDVPEALMDKVIVKKEENEDSKENVEVKPKKKRNKKKRKGTTEVTKDDANQESVHEGEATLEKKKKKSNKASMVNPQETVSTNIATVINQNKKKVKKGRKEEEINKKQEKLKDTKIKPPEDIFKLFDGDEDDSDSTYKFDSDEYEKMINEDEFDSNASTDGDDDRSDDELSIEEYLGVSDSENVPVVQNKKKGKNITVQSKESNKPKATQENIKKQKKSNGPKKVGVPTKKPKFEKQGNNRMPNKQLKKRK